MLILCSLLLAVSISCVSTQPAYAHKRDFAWSNDWFTPLPEEKEIELYNTYNGSEKKWEHQLEYEFAPSKRHAMAFYLFFNEETESDLSGWKWENRYRFGEYENNKWLHGAYLETKKEQGEPYEVEAKWILSRYSHKGDALTLNLIGEKALEGGAEIEYGYSAGWSARIAEKWRAGLESKGNFTEDEYFAGPTLVYDFNPVSRIIVNVSKGLTHRNDDVLIRAFTEFEWFD